MNQHHLPGVCIGDDRAPVVPDLVGHPAVSSGGVVPGNLPGGREIVDKPLNRYAAGIGSGEIREHSGVVSVRMREDPRRNHDVVGVRCLLTQNPVKPVGVLLQGMTAIGDDETAVLQSHHIAHSVEAADIVKQTDLRQCDIADLLHRGPVLCPPTERRRVGSLDQHAQNAVARRV